MDEKRNTVLVIDDEESIREAVQDILDLVGINVFTAANGQEGIEIFTAHRTEIDVVLLDMQMPTMGGEETYHHLFEIDPDVKVILSSGYGEHETARLIKNKTEAPHPMFFLQKPYAIDTLINKVKEACR